MKKVFLMLLLVVTLVSCTSTNDFNKGKAILEQQGYTYVEDTGFSTFCCGQDDSFSTGFKAKDKEGNIVKGCFCSSVLKGITIRFE